MATTKAKKLKNLSNCKPSEFLVQTNKIRKAVSSWLTLTDIQGIRKRTPEFTEDMTEEEKEALVNKQVDENFNAILDSVLEDHEEETLKVLALVNFIDPKDVDNFTIHDYLASLNELLHDKEVISFFTSLIGLGQTSGNKPSKR